MSHSFIDTFYIRVYVLYIPLRVNSKSSCSLEEIFMEWTIQELADKVGVTSHTLRYYEKIGLLRNIRRNENGVRVYTEYDLSWLELIRCLRNTGMPIEGIRQIVELSMQGDHTIPARKQILREHRRKVEQQMEELKNYLDKIDGKLKWYSEQMPD